MRAREPRDGAVGKRRDDRAARPRADRHRGFLSGEEQETPDAATGSRDEASGSVEPVSILPGPFAPYSYVPFA
jgi:hypothetical protein